MLILSGFSEDRSGYCKNTSFLRLYGWVLSPEIDQIIISSGNLEIETVFLTIVNEQVWLDYRKIGNKKCVWLLEKEIKDIDYNNIKIDYFNKGSLSFSQNIQLKLNHQNEKYLDNLSIISRNDIVFNQNKVLKELNYLNIKTEKFSFDEKEYRQWFTEIDYPNNYPQYCREFNEGIILHTKALQHYISLKLLDLHKSDIYIDIASSNSVCPDIITKSYTKNVYRQDLRYKPGINKNKIGSNADNIPLSSKSVNKMALHCSLEHFEDDSDIRFLNEANRILDKNGKIVITPLYMNEKEHILTSPSYWSGKYDQYNYPKFTKNYPLVIKEEIKQRQEKVFSPKSLYEEIINPFKNKFTFEIFFINNTVSDELTNYPQFTLVATKL